MDGLSRKERLILLNQYRLLHLAEPDNPDHRAAIDILESGYASEYSKLYEQLSDEMPSHQMQFVRDVFVMHEQLQRSFKKLVDEGADLAGLTEEDVLFEGFDYNESTEIGMAYFAEYLVRQGMWTHVKRVEGLNSHSRITERYQGRLARLRTMSDCFGVNGLRSLSAEAIRTVLYASGQQNVVKIVGAARA